jgi:hypothetical protein
MQCNKLKVWHPMFGLDFHTCQLPGPVPPAPKSPHITFALICWGIWGSLKTGKPVPTVLTSGGAISLQKGTDAGPLIPHVCVAPGPANLLTPVILAGSASKSYFGASSTLIGKPATAVAVAVGVVVNVNMNCGTIYPTPFDIVVAPNTVVADMTTADFLSGLATAAVESAIQIALNMLFNKVLSGFFRSVAGKVFGQAVMQATDTMAGRIAMIELSWVGKGGVLSQFLSEQLANFIPLLVGDLLGTPQGMSASNVYQRFIDPDIPNESSPAGGFAGDLADAAGKAAANAYNNYNNNPAVDQHPSGGGAGGNPDGGSGTSAGVGSGSGSGADGGAPDGGSGSGTGSGSDGGAPDGGAGGNPDGGSGTSAGVGSGSGSGSDGGAPDGGAGSGTGSGSDGGAPDGGAGGGPSPPAGSH